MEVVQPEDRNTPLLIPSCGPPITPEMELPQGSTWRLNALFPQAPCGPIVHSSLSGIPCHYNLQPIAFSRDSLICVDPEWTWCGHAAKCTLQGLPRCRLLQFHLLLQKRVTMSQFCLRLECICVKYQHSRFLLLHAVNITTWAANLNFFFLTCNLACCSVLNVSFSWCHQCKALSFSVKTSFVEEFTLGR